METPTQQPRKMRVLWLVVAATVLLVFIGAVVVLSTRGLREANKILDNAQLLGQEDTRPEAVIPEGYVPLEYDDFLDEAITALDAIEE